MRIKLQADFIKLVCLGIGHRAEALSETVDWSQLKVLSEQQGLSAILLDPLVVAGALRPEIRLCVF